MGKRNTTVVSTADVAQRMGLSTASIRRFAIDGVLQGRKLGRAWYFDADEAEKFIRTYDSSLDPSRGGGPRGPRSSKR